jgi:ubiquinone/menaquinone biosynthesis C-methylase UbiE
VLYLAKLGYEVVGADFSPGLLELAREKAMAENVKVEFVDGDMRSLRLGECDGVITIDNAIGHLVRYDFEVALRNIYNNLKDGGIYVFDILNLEAMTDEVVESDSERMTDKRVMSDGVVISNKRVSWVDRDKGLITSENNFVIEKNGEKKEIKNKCSLQIYTMEELRDILARNGFELVEQYKIDAYSFKKDDLGYSIMNVARKK